MHPWVSIRTLFLPFPIRPQRGCRFKVKSRDSCLALGLLYLENYIKRPGAGRGGRGGDSPGGETTLCVRRIWPGPGQAVGGRPEGAAPSPSGEEVSWAIPWSRPNPVTTYPLGPLRRRRWGDPPRRPAPLWVRSPRTRSPWRETSPPSDRVPAPPRARTSS